MNNVSFMEKNHMTFRPTQKFYSGAGNLEDGDSHLIAHLSISGLLASLHRGTEGRGD